ncbi:MAG TPA: hypothetical protein VGC45_00965 [Gryllotalpicola sp.]
MTHDPFTRLHQRTLPRRVRQRALSAAAAAAAIALLVTWAVLAHQASVSVAAPSPASSTRPAAAGPAAPPASAAPTANANSPAQPSRPQPRPPQPPAGQPTAPGRSSPPSAATRPAAPPPAAAPGAPTAPNLQAPRAEPPGPPRRTQAPTNPSAPAAPAGPALQIPAGDDAGPPPEQDAPAPSGLLHIDITAEGGQSEVDDCQWVRIDYLGAPAPVVAAHTYCGGGRVLTLQPGEPVHLAGEGLDGWYRVTESRDAHAGDDAGAATAGMFAPTVILQSCYYGDDDRIRLVALTAAPPPEGES